MTEEKKTTLRQAQGSSEPSKIRVRKGKVVSDKMDKTIVVEVAIFKTDKKYKKKYLDTKRYKVHDEKNEAKIDDTVTFSECRPISKDKKWKLVEILNK